MSSSSGRRKSSATSDGGDDADPSVTLRRVSSSLSKEGIAELLELQQKHDRQQRRQQEQHAKEVKLLQEQLAAQQKAQLEQFKAKLLEQHKQHLKQLAELQRAQKIQLQQLQQHQRKEAERKLREAAREGSSRRSARSGSDGSKGKRSSRVSGLRSSSLASNGSTGTGTGLSERISPFPPPKPDAAASDRHPDVPQVQELHPVVGHTSGGATITVTGSNFRRGPGLWCRFGGGSYVPAIWRDYSTLRCIAPPHAPGPVVVEVSNDGQNFSSDGNIYTYIEPEEDKEALHVMTDLPTARGIKSPIPSSPHVSLKTPS